MRAFTALVAALAASLLFAGAHAACRSDGDWEHNAYEHTSLSTLALSDTAPTVHFSANVPSWYQENINAGVTKITAWLGKIARTTFFVAQGGGSDADYQDIMAKYCEYAKDVMGSYGVTSCTHQVVTDMENSMKQGQQFYASPNPKCLSECSLHVIDSTSVYIYPSAQDLSYGNDASKPGTSFIIHEYTHVWQNLNPGIPGWMREGGAVWLECVVGTQMGLYTWKECLERGGGAQGILPSCKNMYDVEDKDWLQEYGEWRPTKGKELDNINYDYGRWVYYDCGALAVGFAVSKAKAKDSSKSTRDFFTAAGGFTDSIMPVDDVEKVTDSEGWKKALLDFTGYSSMTAFYADFKEFAKKSQADQYAVLETEEQIKAIPETATYSASATYWPNSPLISTTCTYAERTSGATTPVSTGMDTPSSPNNSDDVEEDGGDDGGDDSDMPKCLYDCNGDVDDCDDVKKIVSHSCAKDCLDDEAAMAFLEGVYSSMNCGSASDLRDDMGGGDDDSFGTTTTFGVAAAAVAAVAAGLA